MKKTLILLMLVVLMISTMFVGCTQNTGPYADIELSEFEGYDAVYEVKSDVYTLPGTSHKLYMTVLWMFKGNNITSTKVIFYNEDGSKFDEFKKIPGNENADKANAEILYEYLEKKNWTKDKKNEYKFYGDNFSKPFIVKEKKKNEVILQAKGWIYELTAENLIYTAKKIYGEKDIF